MGKNHVEIEGVVKWEPRVFHPRENGQHPIIMLALEYIDKNERRSVFTCKAFGELAQSLFDEQVDIGDTISVAGYLNEAKWKDKKTDQWVNRVEIISNRIEFISRANAGEFGNDFNSSDDDDIPFF